MAPRTVSDPVQRLVDFLNEAQLEVLFTPRRVERWRQAGLFPDATWTGGTGDGSTPTYAPPYEQGLAAIAAVAETRTLGQAALVLWADGWDVPVAKLRRAALEWLNGQKTRYQRKFGGDPERAASATAFTIARHPVGKLWMNRAGGEDPFRSLGDGLAQGFRLGFHHADEAPHTQVDFERVGAVRSMASDALVALGFDVSTDDIDPRLPTSSAKAAGSAFREASSEEWELARAFASMFRALLPEQPDLHTGFNRALLALSMLVTIHTVIGADVAADILDRLMNT
jgi:hypothetical protein